MCELGQDAGVSLLGELAHEVDGFRVAGVHLQEAVALACCFVGGFLGDLSGRCLK